MSLATVLLIKYYCLKNTRIELTLGAMGIQ